MLDTTVVDSAPRAHAREAGTLRSDSVSRLLEDGRDRNAATGRFLPGNRAWKARRPAGPAPKFADGEALWKACVKYFEWVEDNPLYEMQLVKWKGRSTQVPVPRPRPMTKGGLCLFLHVQRSSWNAWKRDRPDLASTIERVESVIWDWQFTHAAAGLLDAGMVIRQLAIGRKTEPGFCDSTRARTRASRSRDSQTGG
jgi:hypothetical protein